MVPKVAIMATLSFQRMHGNWVLRTKDQGPVQFNDVVLPV